MSLVIKKNPSNPDNYCTKERPLENIKWIVIHYTGNDGDTDEANAKYFNGSRGVSAHYFVDDDSATESVNPKYPAWSVGGNKYPSCAKTGGGVFYGKCTNFNSISIEICDVKRNGISDFTTQTIANVVELTQMLMKKYNIDITHVIRHFDVVGKDCPQPFCNVSRKDGDEAWAAFKCLVANSREFKKLKISVFGEEREVKAIEVDGSNYVKLRDLEKKGKLEVSYINKKIYINKTEFIPMDTILVDGNNYVKVRNLQKLGFKVDWIKERKIVSIN